jgi:hypothetical protein
MSADQISSPRALHLLVVVAQAARGEELRHRFASLSRGGPLELLVLAPAFASSALKYIASDVDEGIRKARGRLERSLVEMNGEDRLHAAGEVGEADPLMAIDSALVSFLADEIVIVPSPQHDQWAEKELFAHVCARFDLPVRQIELEDGATGTHAVQTACTLASQAPSTWGGNAASAQRL